MSFELLNLYTNATLPQNFTGLDRHLLEHYCNRHIDDLGKAFPDMHELVRVTGVAKTSVLRSRRRLVTDGALIQITKGYPGQQSEFAVSKEYLLEHQQVTEGLPITRNWSPVKPEQVTVKTVTSHPTVSDASLSGYPIQEHNKTKTQQAVSSYSSQLIELIPANKRFAINDTIKELLSTLEHKGTSINAIRAVLPVDSWESIVSPKAFVTSLLRDLVTRPVQYNATNRPPKCANPDCDEVTRTLPYRVSVPNGNGQTTQSCLECNHFWVNKRNGF
jgi:hypothetical protein